MVFSPPPWVPKMGAIPTAVPVGDFALSGAPSRPRAGAGRPSFTDGISGWSYSVEDLTTRVDHLARALSRELRWSPSSGTPRDKVVAILSLNTLDYFVVCWAVHRLNGICMPLHSTSTVGEVTTHMKNGGSMTIVSCQSSMSTALEAAKQLSIPKARVYALKLPDKYAQSCEVATSVRTIGSLVTMGSALPPLEPLVWDGVQGKSQVAYLCPTSGTSGRQKLAMLTHYGLIVNIIQTVAFEDYAKTGATEVEAGAVPFSHAYGILVSHMALWRGDQYIVFPRFDMQLMLESVPKYKIERLYLVPPILAALVANPFLLELYDLSSVKASVTGAAALNPSLAEKLHTLRPTWQVIHAWGSTETCIVATMTSPHDVWYGSSGSLLPGAQLRLVGPDGEEINDHDRAGEILFKSHGGFIGYLGNEEESRNAWDAEGWLRTGDVGVIKISLNGTEHLFIRDRIKDMIKVKGNQVVPADIEAVLATHPAVIDAAVIGVPDELAGERPMAFVVRSTTATTDADEEDVRESIDEHVQDQLHETHWLHERIRFIPEIPRSPNGKIVKKMLKASVGGNGV